MITHGIILMVGVCTGSLMGLGLAFYLELSSQTLPVPQLRAGDCFIHRHYEPWQVYPDGQVLKVGRRLYLMVNRTQRNSQDRYNGNKVYGFETPIAEADRQYQRLECPQSWHK